MSEENQSKKIVQPKLLRGMRDSVPDEQEVMQWVVSRTEEIANDYGYRRIETPILESTSLFNRGVGDGTDIVEKEMYSFEDRGGDNISLRPEFTAGLMRAYGQHGFISKPQPVKIWTHGPLFRYDRPQSGRYRQHSQLDFEAMGDPAPVLDAQLINIAYKLLSSFGLDIRVMVNSIGDRDSKTMYQGVLTEYYKAETNLLCEDCQRRLKINPLRLLDCKEEDCRDLSGKAPQMIDYLSEPSRLHFVSVLEYLDELEVPYELNHRIVRGLDYYSETTFEIFSTSDDERASQRALGGGGRYNYLAESLGIGDVPGVGFGLGLERIVLALKDAEIKPPESEVNVFVAQLGDESRRGALAVYERLLKAGYKPAEKFSKDSIKSQLEIADKLGVRYTIIIGQKEIHDGTVIIRDMDGGIQEEVDLDKIEVELAKRFEN